MSYIMICANRVFPEHFVNFTRHRIASFLLSPAKSSLRAQGVSQSDRAT